jgi:hypothetical protein
VGDYSRLDSPTARIQDGDPDDLRARQLSLPSRRSSQGRRFYELKYIRLKLFQKNTRYKLKGVATLPGTAVFTVPTAAGNIWTKDEFLTLVRDKVANLLDVDRDDLLKADQREINNAVRQVCWEINSSRQPGMPKQSAIVFVQSFR